MERSDPTPLAQLARQAADLSNAVVARARATGRDDLADLLTGAASRWTDPQVTVVVAGEVGVGKSALLNALAGTPRLLPVASEPTTGVVTLLEAAPEGRAPTVSVRLDDRDDALSVPLGELPAWVALQGEHRAAVAQVTVTAPAPRLASRVTLVDTPGVAGPHTSADRLVLALLARADLLVFVTDPDAPIGRPELEFLRRAQEEVGTCVVALSRIDRFRGWPTILEDSTAILHRELGGWVRHTAGVSSALAEVADELVDEDPAAAGELAAEAGVEALAAHLHALAQRAKHLRLRNLVVVARRVLVELGRAPGAQADAAAASPDDLRAELDRLRDEHTALKTAGTAVLASLADEVGALREELNVELRRVVGEVTLDHEERLLSSRVDVDEVLDAVEHDLRAAQLRLTDLVEVRLADIGDRLAERLEGPGTVDELPASASEDEARPRRALASKRDGSLRLRVAAAVASAGGGTVMMGMSVMSTGGGADALRSGLMGVSMVLGSVAASSGVRQTRQQKVLQSVRAQARAILDEWQAATMARIRARIQAGQRELDGALRAAVRGRLVELEDQVGTINEALQASAAERQALADQAASAAAAVQDLEAAASSLAAALDDALGPVTGAVPTVRS